MAASIPFTIPTRFSSRSAIHQRKLKNRESQNDLKRKLSDVSAADTEIILKLRIEEAVLEREEYEIKQDAMDVDMEEGLIDARTFKKHRLENSKRINSISDSLWNFRRQRNEHNERLGKLDQIGPDSAGALVAVLLRLYKDPRDSRARSSKVQSDFRQDVITAYSSSEVDDKGEKKYMRCSITGELGSPGKMKAAHLIPSLLGPELVDYICGPGLGLRLYRPENGLIMEMEMEQAFDAGNFVLVPVDVTERPIRRWKVMIVNEGSRGQTVTFPESGAQKLGSIDGRELEFRTDQRPSARFLYYHFVITILLARHQGKTGWENTLAKLRNQTPWPTPGAYLRKSMLMTLARSVGVDDEQIDKIIEEHTFQQNESLTTEAEEEIVNQINHIQYEKELRAISDDCYDMEDEDEDEDVSRQNEKYEETA